MIRFIRPRIELWLAGWIGFAAAMVVLLVAPAAWAADIGEGLGRYWLPPDRSTHGHSIDALFVWTFWITMIVFVAVEIVLVYFLIKYRYRKEQEKAHFTHGNTRLEMCWTLAPAVIFIALAVANKGVWENLRFNPAMDKPGTAQLLVIGQQFKWNVIYPGPDGKLGKYLIYPKPTDVKWSDPRTDAAKKSGKPFLFARVEGPAYLPYEQAVKQIGNYIDQFNKLGKDFDDADGKDDNWSPDPGRALNIPVNRPVEVQLGSKDVIHDFFLPNYRVKLDAVPGLRGKLVFTATMTSREREAKSLRGYELGELESLFQKKPEPNLTLRIDEKSPGAVKDPKANLYLYATDPGGTNAIARNDQPLNKASVEKLKAAGITKVEAYEPGAWELVCEELCGSGHTTMRADLFVLDQEEYAAKFEGKKAAPTSAPMKPVAVAK